MRGFLIWFLAALCLSSIEGYRILGLFPYEGRSHFIMPESLMKELAAKGHEVVVISHFPQKTPLANYTDRSLVGSRQGLIDAFSIEFIREQFGFYGVMKFIFGGAGVQLCEDIYKHQVIQDLIKSEEKFDVMINELWGTDCFLAIAHKLGIPHISMVTTTAFGTPWGLDRYGNPHNPSYIPCHFTGYVDGKMTFWEKIVNTLYMEGLKIAHRLFSEIPSDAVVKKYLGADTPYIRDIAYNSSLLFTNSHLSVNKARPFVPSIVEVGGLHIPRPKPLPKDIKQFLDEATDGVIIFSMGSLVNPESLGQQRIQELVKVFANLPQRVLWKFNAKIENQPKNLKVVQWLPQSDALNHTNTKLFITHGGLMGTQEALLAGVPLIGIPFFADQEYNINNYVDMGIAVGLSYEDFNGENLLRSIKTVLGDKRYAERSKFIASTFKDRPQSARETAVYWTEYVVRHRGAPHLKSAATQLYWYQALLLDVILVLAVALFVILWVTKKVFCVLIKVVCGGKSKKLKTQ